MTEQREKAAAEPPLDCRVSRNDQDGFEASRFYFCGETQAERIVFWEIWKAACDWRKNHDALIVESTAAIAHKGPKEKAAQAFMLDNCARAIRGG